MYKIQVILPFSHACTTFHFATIYHICMPTTSVCFLFPSPILLNSVPYTSFHFPILPPLSFALYCQLFYSILLYSASCSLSGNPDAFIPLLLFKQLLLVQNWQPGDWSSEQQKAALITFSLRCLIKLRLHTSSKFNSIVTIIINIHLHLTHVPEF